MKGKPPRMPRQSRPLSLCRPTASYVGMDNRLHALRQAPLPADLGAKLHQAYVHFFGDEDALAEKLVTEIEQACAEQGIPIPPSEFP